MFFPYMYLLAVLVVTLVISFVLNKSHIIMLLLILEAMMLVLLVYLLYLLVELNSDPYMFLLLLAFSACEAALGLSILVVLMRFHGNDYINCITNLKW